MLGILAGGNDLSNLEGCEGFTYKFRFDSELRPNDYVGKWEERIGFACEEG